MGGVWCRLSFVTLDEVASRDFGHKREPFLCVYVSDMAIVCACHGRDLYVRVYGGFSFNDTSWAISAIVRV